jgi:hypothetical protein
LQINNKTIFSTINANFKFISGRAHGEPRHNILFNYPDYESTVAHKEKASLFQNSSLLSMTGRESIIVV